MSTNVPAIQPLDQCRDTALAGGKAVNLGILLRARFPVPGGFVVTTAAYRSTRVGRALPAEVTVARANVHAEAPETGTVSPAGSARPTALPADLVAQILSAYSQMGAGPVAVRSSATAEDMAGASMAGQYDTFLHVHDEATLLDAVARCWQSLDSPRTRSYLQEHGIDINQVAMAVVVQRLVRADVAGVLFTANPRTGARGEMLAEGAWGLGEAVVSGRVQPDVLRIDRESGNVIDQRIADKRIMIPPGGDGEVETPEHLRRIACLTESHIRQLWQLGRKAADHFGNEQDIEWATENGTLFLLQSRPITTLQEAEAYDRILHETQRALGDELTSGRGPWVRHNLGETLPHPTPLTWSVMQRFMTGAGGFGAMYRMAGFAPSDAVNRDGFLRLVAGRVYMDTSAAAGMFFGGFPFKYDLQALRTNPDAAQAPPTLPAGSFLARWKAGRRIAGIKAKLAKTADDLDRRLREDEFPKFTQWVNQEKARDLAALSAAELASLWNERQKRVMDEFAPLSLLPSLVEGMVLADLQQFLAEFVWDRDAAELATTLSSPPKPNMTLLADAGLYEISRGKRTVNDWLKQFGHRAAGEFDLATPRWREQPAAVLAMADRLAGGVDPKHLHEQHTAGVRGKIDAIRSRLSTADAKEFDRRLDRVWRYMAFREDGKYFLMLGYELLRDVAVEAGRRMGVGPDVFYLTEQEMLKGLTVSDGRTAVPSPGTPGEGVNALRSTITDRKRDYRAEARISLPHVIDSTAIATLGAPPKLDAAGMHEAFAVSTGVATGPARIVLSPAEAGDLGKGYVLVCPSTDPNWTPLFVNAAALVLECGGTLSHGAVVAREMGLPAVVLADATRLFAEGQSILVDGHNGAVGAANPPKAEAAEGSAVATPAGTLDYQDNRTSHEPVRESIGPRDHENAVIAPELIPPPPGPKDRRATRWRNVSLLVWGIYLLLVFVLPENWLYQPSLRVLDKIYWPLVPAFGKPWTVAIIAGAIAVITMVLQRLMSDNARLQEAKRRSNELSKEAAKLPPGSPRRNAITRLTAPVQARLFGAAMAPMALALGPMVMTFFWFPARVDPASWNPPPGTPVEVVATPDAKAHGVLTLKADEPLWLDPASAAGLESRAHAAIAPIEEVGPVREALAQLLGAWETPASAATPDSALREQIDFAKSRGENASGLKAYLATGVQPNPMNWSVHTPDRAGKYPITVAAPDGTHLTLNAVVGDAAPPDATEILGDPGTALAGVKLVYIGKHSEPFWRPLASVTWKPIVDRAWNQWEAGWLLVYLLAYLPAMYAARKLLRVA